MEDILTLPLSEFQFGAITSKLSATLSEITHIYLPGHDDVVWGSSKTIIYNYKSGEGPCLSIAVIL